MGKRITLFVIGPRGFPGVQGGIERFSEGLYPRLTQMGYDVTTFAMKQYCRHRSWRGIRFIYAPTVRHKNLEKTLYNLYAALYCILKRPDVIHIHSIASGLFIFLMKVFGLKIVARYNSRDYLHAKWSFIGRIALKISEKQFLLADHIITNNRDYQAMLESMTRKTRVSFVPNGVEIPDKEKYLEHYQHTFARTFGTSRFILYAGRVTPEKNLETLLRAFSTITVPNLKLVIAGDHAQDENYLKSLTQAASENVVFLGSVERESLCALYAACSLFVLPSVSEGMPNVLLEAMSFDCRILASRIPAHVAFGFRDESYFELGDASGLRDKILTEVSTGTREDHSARLSSHRWPGIVAQIHHIHQQIMH